MSAAGFGKLLQMTAPASLYHWGAYTPDCRPMTPPEVLELLERDPEAAWLRHSLPDETLSEFRERAEAGRLRVPLGGTAEVALSVRPPVGEPGKRAGDE